MGRKTIDFGIDLGTTDSVIACMDQGELVLIRNQVTNSEITPSAVKMDARGSITVGQNAYDELEEDPDNAVGEFKRWMGNPEVDGFTFKRAGKRMTAAQLSAEVLKTLKSSATAGRFAGEQLGAAVITVPAHFLIPACEDTKEAAKLAGIELCPFIQEPVAAAMAYGYRAESLSGNLLVFDLGGGTFDTTLLSARDGKLVVLGHDGDDKLGGKDFDWSLVELIVRRLQQEYGELPLVRSNPAARRIMATLKYRAEDAKKTLSALQKASIEIKRLGAPFEQIDTVVELTRADLQRVTEYLAARCIAICKRLLERSGLSADGLANVLVVGGQTQTPYLRELILSEFGKAEYKLDPLTVVAAGAALYASTQRIPAGMKQGAGRGSVVTLKIAYQPVSSEEDADIGLTVEPPSSVATVTILRRDGGWSSGAIPVPAPGKLFATVVLRPKRVNVFAVELKDARGSRISVDDDSFSITQGLEVAQSTTSRDLRIALVDNVAEVMIPKGSPIPAKGTLLLKTAHDVIAGDPKSVLRTYVLEGDCTRSDRNIGIGTIELRGIELRRNLPAGHDAEIRYSLDESKILSAEAFFPTINETCVMVRKVTRPALLPSEIDLELGKERDRLVEIQRAAPDRVDGSVDQRILLIEREKEAAAEDADAQQKAAQEILELKAELDALESLSEWELLAVELDNFRRRARKLSQTSGTQEQVRNIEESIRTAEAALSRRDVAALRSAIEKLKAVYWAINLARDEYWKEQFAWLKEEADLVDSSRAESLREEGVRALKRSDIGSLRSIVRDLWGLLPKWQQSKLEGLYNSGLLSTIDA